MVKNEFLPWIFDKILQKRLTLIEEYYRNNYEVRLKAFSDMCEGEQVRNEVKNDYDAVLKGLNLETEIFTLFKNEFERFCG